MSTVWLEALVEAITRLAPPGTLLSYSFGARGLLAILLVSVICGAVGSLVVGNRMSFFSDALAHVAFAGASLGWLLAFTFGLALAGAGFEQWLLAIMVGLGILVGTGIAYVRDVTGLASDTVIGVFFAGAMGFGIMLLKNISKSTRFHPEAFIFGDLVNVTLDDILYLLVLAFVILGAMALLYNRLLFASFNTSLAQSRQIPVRLYNYLFIVLLALIVNLCFRMVGVLLITALLIVPAATAANLSRNLRQMFWLNMVLSLGSCVGGLVLSWELDTYMKRTGRDISFIQGGTIVILGVLAFFLSMIVPALRRRSRGAA
jgi:zinc transport system permease protein